MHLRSRNSNRLRFYGIPKSELSSITFLTRITHINGRSLRDFGFIQGISDSSFSHQSPDRCLLALRYISKGRVLVGYTMCYA